MRSASAILALPLLLGLGCAEEGAGGRPAVSGTDPAWSPEVRARAWQEALGRIEDATCDREQSCGTIGPGGTFHSREECIEAARAKTERGVSEVQCPGGVDRAAFQRCLDSLEAGQCAQPGDAITRSARCDAADLCLK
jgi:hypothetical protein